MARTMRCNSWRVCHAAVIAVVACLLLAAPAAVRADANNARPLVSSNSAPASNAGALAIDSASSRASDTTIASAPGGDADHAIDRDETRPDGSGNSGTSAVADAKSHPNSTNSASAAGNPRDAMPLGKAKAPLAPTSTGNPRMPDAGWALTSLAALGAVIGLILLMRFGLLKLVGRPAAITNSAVLEVLARFSVAPKNHVLITRIGQRVLVLGDSPHGLNTLANIDNPEEVAAILQAVAVDKPGSISRGFDQMLEEFNGDYDSPAALLRHEGADEGEHRVDRARDSLSTLTARLRSLGSPNATAAPLAGADKRRAAAALTPNRPATGGGR